MEALLRVPGAAPTTQQALALLGMQRLRAWVALLAMSTLDDKPQEILVNCLVRARTAENMARATGQTKPCRYFIAGMLSLLDAVLDQPMDQLVDELPLTPDLRQALLTRKGDVGRALHSIEAQERGAWKHMAFQHLTPTEVQSCWLESLQWTRNIAQALDS